jgi:hypothetical protein
MRELRERQDLTLFMLIIERIPISERHQIAVHVMDLSWPDLARP